MSTLVIHRSTNPSRPSGSITINGSFLTSPPGDAFSGTQGFAARIQSFDVDQSVSVAPADCRSSKHGVRCRSADKTVSITLQPFHSSPLQYGFRLRAKKLPINPPFQPGASVDLAQGALVTGFDRTGTVAAASCNPTASGMNCRQP